MPARAHSVSRAAIAFFVDMKTVAARGQSGNLRLDGDFVALLRKGDRAGRGFALGWFQPRDGGLGIRGQRRANGERTDRRGEYQTLHGISWTTTNDIAAVGPSMHRMISERLRLAKRRGTSETMHSALPSALRRIAPHCASLRLIESAAKPAPPACRHALHCRPAQRVGRSIRFGPAGTRFGLAGTGADAPEESANASSN